MPGPRERQAKRIVKDVWRGVQGTVGKTGGRQDVKFLGGKGYDPWEAEQVHTKRGSKVTMNKDVATYLTRRGPKRGKALELLLHESAHGLQNPKLKGKGFETRNQKLTEGGAQSWVRQHGTEALKRAGVSGKPRDTRYPREVDWVNKHKGPEWVSRGQFDSQALKAQYQKRRR